MGKTRCPLSNSWLISNLTSQSQLAFIFSKSKDLYLHPLSQREIFKKISDILEDEKEHEYKIHKKTLTTPPAVEINLKEMPSYLKDNIYILKELESIIKNQYDFENVYINFENSENKKFIDLNFYMILE